MIGCNQVMVQERNLMIQQRNQMIKEISTSQHYLNTTPAPQPTLFLTKPQATGTCSIQYFNKHPEIKKAASAFQYIYTTKPALIYVNVTIDRPIPGVNSFIHPLTLTAVENNKITTDETIQSLQKIHQQLQRIKIGKTITPQEIINQVMATYQIIPPSELSIVSPALSVLINYQKAVIASQNGNYMPLVAVYSHVQLPAWRNYFVGCYQMAQKDHATAKVDTK